MCYVRAITPTGSVTPPAPEGPQTGAKGGQSDELGSFMLASMDQTRSKPSGNQQNMMDELLMDSFGLDASNSSWLLGPSDTIHLSLFGDSTSILPNNMLPWTGLPVPAPATFIVQPSPSLLSVHASNIGSKVVATSAPIPSQLVPGGQATLLNMNQSNMRATPPQTFNAYAHSSALNVSVASVNSRPAMIIPSQPSQMQPHVPVHMSQNICQVPMGLSEMVQMPIGLSLPSQVPEMNNGMPCHSLQPSQQGRLFSVPRKFMPHFHGSPPLLSPPLRKQSMSQSSSHADKSETASVTSSQLSPPFLLVGGIGSTVPFPPSKPSPTASTASKPQKRSLDESDPAVSKCSSKSKKSAKLIHLETKCSSLERENESLQMRLAVLENGSKLFSQREQELLNRVKALECQLGESHRVMLQQLGNSHS